jgi:hypothetical protein
MKMMIRNKFIKLVILFLIFHPTFNYSQENDFGLWTSVTIEKKINYLVDISLSQEFRFNNNIQHIDKFFTDAGINFRINKFINAGLYYRFINEYSFKKGYIKYTRIYGDFTEKFKISRLTISPRIRMQSNDYQIANAEGNYNGIINRDKISFKYNIKNCQISPYISYEIFYIIYRFMPSYLSKTRFSFGGEYKLRKNHYITLYYLIQQEYNKENPMKLFVAGIEYKYNF